MEVFLFNTKFILRSIVDAKYVGTNKKIEVTNRHLKLDSSIDTDAAIEEGFAMAKEGAIYLSQDGKITKLSPERKYWRDVPSAEAAAVAIVPGESDRFVPQCCQQVLRQFSFEMALKNGIVPFLKVPR